MLIAKDIQIEAACAKDKARWALNAPWLEVGEDGAKLCATDGKLLVVADVEAGPDDTTGPVNPAALKAGRKLAKRGAQVDISANGNLKLADDSTMPRYVFPEPEEGEEPGKLEDLRFPDCECLIPGGPPEYVVTLRADAIARMAKATGAEELRFEFFGHNRPARVVPRHIESSYLPEDRAGVVAIIMPISDDIHKGTLQ